MHDIKALAKIHDILKLTAENHYCPDHIAGFNELPDDIKRSLKHHCITPWGHRCAPFAMEAASLCIKLADIKASTISRKLKVAGGKRAVTSREIFKIWKGGNGQGDAKKHLVSREEIFDELRKTDNLDLIYSRYADNFRLRSEDARRPFSSLDTHNDLTARWAYFLYENRKHYGIPESIEDRNFLRKILYGFNKKPVCILRAKLNTNYKLSRLRDAKLIKDIPDLLSQLANMCGAAIYELPEEVLLIGQSGIASELGAKVKKLLGKKTNYFFETVTVETALDNKKFLSNYEKIFGSYEETLYPVLEKDISPLDGNEASHKSIICDMCQMAPARIVYPREVYKQDDPIEEYLCEGCIELRKDTDVRSTKLCKWEELEDRSAAFFKITLDMKALIEILKQMYAKEFNLKKELLHEDLGFSILKEFLYDYKDFLTRFREMALLKGGFDENRSDIILGNLFCVLAAGDADIKPVIDAYADMARSAGYFEKMVTFSVQNKCRFPIRFSATISNVKFPFMEHWQYLNSPQEDINIYSAPHTKLEVNFHKYDLLRNMRLEDRKISAALHNLCEIEDRTHNPFLVHVSMLEMKNDLKELATDLITTAALSVNEALAYYKLMRKSSENGK